MDIRNIFHQVSEQLLSEFRKTSEVRHSGGKGSLREDAFRGFLRDYLPTRYAVGRGEVITPENRVSGELDIVIYDPSHCPALIRSTSHSVYPIESVFGAISIKSHLDSRELRDAYQNIVKFKKIVPAGSFANRVSMGPTFMFVSPNPVPVTGIVAYGANRSFDAIAQQVRELDEALSDIRLRPDFVTVIGMGIVGPRGTIRGDANKYELPQTMDGVSEKRMTGRHTLFRTYMQILRELNTIKLKPLDISAYDDMPRLVGPYRVRLHDRFVRYSDNGAAAGNVLRLNESGINEIVSRAVPVTGMQMFLDSIGSIPDGASKAELEIIVYQYNPRGLPPVDLSCVKAGTDGRPFLEREGFRPSHIEIDGKKYGIDLGALSPEFFEDRLDMTLEELMSS